LVTILINANVFRRRPAWLEKLLGTFPHEPAEALDFFGIPYVAVDLDLSLIHISEPTRPY